LVEVVNAAKRPVAILIAGSVAGTHRSFSAEEIILLE
jgi:hypothetical protein